MIKKTKTKTNKINKNIMLKILMKINYSKEYNSKNRNNNK